MTDFCTHCGTRLSADVLFCTQCGLAATPVVKGDVPTAPMMPNPPVAKKDRRWWWWVLALIVFFALGVFLGHLFAPKCPSCLDPAGDGTGTARNGRGSGTSALDNGPPQKLGNGSGKGSAEAAGGSSTGDIEGSGKIIPHEITGKEDTGNSLGHKSQDGDPTLDVASGAGSADPELYGAVAQLAQGVAPYGAAAISAHDNPAGRTKSLVAYDFTYDKTNLPRYSGNVRDVASSISYALDPKTGEHTGAYGTGAGIVTTSSFDDVVDWYRKNVPPGWHSSSIGDFGQLTQQLTQGPSGDLMKLLKGELPGAASTNGNANPAAPKVRVALFTAPTTAAASPDSTIMILQKDDKPVSVYLQTQAK